ncbi:tRNA lysidine(34) synthetase TilS [Reichenbachiella agarivorans]|uniref:tRNA(Ile)-lysidine synthase n=1 Tax=Reichenbachiella agarivorans TaxID=2979464 RepID=A0ABY6CJD4_9BACT|nr:tRNA lysidine(34) synthetase TilS [Reichenbachiella agarivorans]UXP30635.1 tRNA lysidine(34) synthetase TilS [Reichenbachiella agarivorans]
MANLIEKFDAYITKHGLFSREDKLLATVSGGIDSIVLCHLLKGLGYNFSIAHCNFGLRGKESDLDQKLVEDLGSQLGVTVYVKKFETSEYAASQKISTQMAARDLRYAWFNELLANHELDLILTAHHANDLIETSIFNFSKGTGVAGLRGIQKKNGKLVRPLSFATKDDIIAYAQAQQLTWREDASNSCNKYHRNRIRHKIINQLKKINPSLESTYLHTQERLESLESLLTNTSKTIRNKYMVRKKNITTLNMTWFELEKGGLVILEDILRPYGFSLQQCQAIITSLYGLSGKQFFSQYWTLVVDRKKLIITHDEDHPSINLSLDADQEALTILDHRYVFHIQDMPVEIIKSPEYAFLDADKIEFPIQVRNWQEGDRFVPLGMKSQKKLSDFMIDEKIPVNLKERLLIFESNQNIIWIAGKRIDDRFKITDQTKKVFIIKQERNV